MTTGGPPARGPLSLNSKKKKKSHIYLIISKLFIIRTFCFIWVFSDNVSTNSSWKSIVLRTVGINSLSGPVPKELGALKNAKML